jgi:quinoprotein glucose dehydrogenase
MANLWSLITADETLGMAYFPLTSPTNDMYGGQRLGNNLFSDTLVAVKCSTGERVWHYQTTHHDLWDYDLPAAPILADIVVDGKPIKAVVQLTKQAFAFVFDRVTGAPVWPIVERPVSTSDTPSERTSPTQPFPSKPAAFDRQGVTLDDLIDFTPELRAQALELVKQYKLGPLFTPPTVAGGSIKGTVQLPGSVGGADWQSGAFDPETKILYVQSITAPFVADLVKDAAWAEPTGRLRVGGDLHLLMGGEVDLGVRVDVPVRTVGEPVATRQGVTRVRHGRIKHRAAHGAEPEMVGAEAARWCTTGSEW